MFGCQGAKPYIPIVSRKEVMQTYTEAAGRILPLKRQKKGPPRSGKEAWFQLVKHLVKVTQFAQSFHQLPLYMIFLQQSSSTDGDIFLGRAASRTESSLRQFLVIKKFFL